MYTIGITSEVHSRVELMEQLRTWLPELRKRHAAWAAMLAERQRDGWFSELQHCACVGRLPSLLLGKEGRGMLSLASARWSQLRASGGNPSLVPRLIQSLADAPSTGYWDEVWEQLSHQWSGYSIAFAAIPHLVQLAMQQGIAKTPGFLLGLGRTVDSLVSLGPPPADLKGEFDAALCAIAPVVQAAARTSGYSRVDYLCVLHAAAALSGRNGLGTELFFSLFASGPELDCPHCRGYLSGEFVESGLAFQSVNSHMQPLSGKAWVRPRELISGPPDNTPLGEDFHWLVGLCEAAKQEQLLKEICLLYGSLRCPLCGKEIVVMSEMLHSREGGSNGGK
jgi:hypothetical protein